MAAQSTKAAATSHYLGSSVQKRNACSSCVHQYLRVAGLKQSSTMLTCVDLSKIGAQATAGSLQSLCWASSAVGGIVSAYFSGSLVDAWGTRGVFAATAVFPLFVCGAALLIDEQRVGHKDSDGGGAAAGGQSLLHSGALQQVHQSLRP